MESRRCRHGAGFTLVEMLVVVGLIIALIAIVASGLRHVKNTAARHETIVELKICTDILKEYESINGLKNLEAAQGSVTVQAQVRVLPYPVWIAGYCSIPIYLDVPGPDEILTGDAPHSAIATTDLEGAQDKNAQTSTRGQGNMADQSDMSGPRWSSNAVRWSQCAMAFMLKDPKNRAMMSTVPPKRLLESPPWVGATGTPPKYTIEGALPLDGWGNPILFVPRGGIHLMMNPGERRVVEEVVVRSSGVYRLPAPPVGPNDRPFFASAGQDGYFMDLRPNVVDRVDKASDNVYSFGEQ